MAGVQRISSPEAHSIEEALADLKRSGIKGRSSTQLQVRLATASLMRIRHGLISCCRSQGSQQNARGGNRPSPAIALGANRQTSYAPTFPAPRRFPARPQVVIIVSTIGNPSWTKEIVLQGCPMNARLLCVVLLMLSIDEYLHAADQRVGSAEASVLICNGRDWPSQFVDYGYLRELHEHGSQIEATEGQRLTWDRISKFHCLVLYNLQADQAKTIYGAMPGPPFRPEFQALLDRYLKAGGGEREREAGSGRRGAGCG
jgi:hypothetical protein